MSNDESPSVKFDRADFVVRAKHGHSLPDQLGRRLRSVFSAPQTEEERFNSLLERISSLLP